MYFEKNRRLFEEVKALSQIERHVLLLDLLCEKVVCFTEVSELYVSSLETKETKRNHSMGGLVLLLSMYCADDATPAGKNARKHLYESGYYTEKDGSGFGKKLGDEFNNPKKDNT